MGEQWFKVNEILAADPVENAHFDGKRCCDAHNDMFANVWHVLTKEENAYSRIDRIVKWVAIYIIFEGKYFDGKPEQGDYEFNKQMYYCARRKIWEYVRNHCKEEMSEIQEGRQWKAGKAW